MDPVQQFLFEPVPTLQEIASLKITLSLYPSILRHIDQNSDELKMIISSLTLGMPKQIAEILQNRYNSICNATNDWIFDFNNVGVLSFIPGEIGFRIAEHIVWKQNGEIDEKKTAQNVCLRHDLCAVRKFEFMCRYCLKDEIDNTPLDSLPPAFLEFSEKRSVAAGNFDLFIYWIRYKENKLHTIPFEGFVSLDAYVLSHNTVWETWSAAEYFWDRLSAEDQVSVAQTLIVADGAILIHLKKLWAKMNRGQRSALSSTIPVKIVLIFWREMLEFELARAIWLQIRGFVTGDQFVEMIRMLTYHTLSPQECEIELLVDVWNSAPDHLKDYLLEYKKDEILRSYCMPEQRPHNMKLLLAMLRYSSMGYRRDFIKKYGSIITELVGEDDHSVVKNILHLCASQNF